MNKVVACTNKMPVQHDLARRKLHESILTMRIPGTPSILPRYSFHASAASRRTTLRLTRPSRLYSNRATSTGVPMSAENSTSAKIPMSASMSTQTLDQSGEVTHKSGAAYTRIAFLICPCNRNTL